MWSHQYPAPHRCSPSVCLSVLQQLYQIQQVTMPAGQELTQPMFIQSTNQTADAQVTQVSTDWAEAGTFSPHTHNTHTSPWDADRCHQLGQRMLDNVDFTDCSYRRGTQTIFFCNKFTTLDKKTKQRDTDWLSQNLMLSCNHGFFTSVSHICREKNMHPLPPKSLLFPSLHVETSKIFKTLKKNSFCSTFGDESGKCLCLQHNLLLCGWR